MAVIIGWIALIAAVAVVVGGVVSNSGSVHASGDFDIFGQFLINTSTGMLFLYGAVAGIVGMLGLILLWGAFTRQLAFGRVRRELKHTKHETEILRQDRDRLNKELETERSKHLNASTPTPTEVTPVVE